MTNSRFYSSTASATTLQVTMAPGDTAAQVVSSAGFPGSFPFTLSLDYGSANEELVDVTNGGPTNFTVTRAVDGTSASTHNAGAVVRHVSSARDFTDSRTHEASSTGVHGITGAFVDTASVQTLTNKTLTNPTINNATLAGTLTGTPTFSGAVSHTADINITGKIQATESASTNTVNASLVTADIFDRYRQYADGKLEWGSGAAARDTNLYRSAANQLQTDDTVNAAGGFVSTRSLATDSTFQAKVAGDTQPRLNVAADGTHSWGSGTAATDTALARTGVATLGVTGALTVSGTTTLTGGLTGTVSGNPTFSGNPAFTGAPTFTPVTAVDAAIIPDTVTNGWSLNSAAGRKAGGVTTVRINVERVGSNIVASASGNIADTKIGTLAAGWRPLDGTMVTNYDMSGIAAGSVSIGNDGIVTIKSLFAGNTIGLADTVNFSLTFVSSS